MTRSGGTTALVTIVSGRHDHLLNQQRGILASSRLPELYVVVSMGDPAALAVTDDGPLAESSCRVVTRLLPTDDHLPLARARNLGAELALAAGADILVFLDVDCVPSASLLDTYIASVTSESTGGGPTGSSLHCGVVQYLPPEVDAAQVEPSALTGTAPAFRPHPQPGESIRSGDWQLFWSLSFAVSADTWRRVGGFHEAYVGYGAEDTDLGLLAHHKGIDLRWVGGADAFHQYHPTTALPVAHLDDIIRNAGIFQRRWGCWPMEGWLRGFQDAGLAEYDEALGWRVR